MTQEALSVQILRLTTRMRELADTGEWEDLSILAQQRQSMLERLVESDIASEDLQSLAGLLRDSDRQVSDLADVARQETVAELERHRAQSGAARTYAEHAGEAIQSA